MSAVPTPRTARTRPSTKTAAALLPQTAPSHAMATTQAARPAELTETELTSGVFVAVRVRPLEALPSKAQPQQQQQQQQQPSQSHFMTRSYATTTEDENNTNEEGGMTSVPSSLSATTPETHNYNNSATMSTPASLHAAHVSNRCVHLYPGNVVECEFTAGHGRSSLANTNQANVMQDDAVRARPVFSMSCHAVFDEGSTQAELMDIVGRRAVGRVLQGYHGTVLCYGQSGSGKTYTLLGPRGGVVDEKAVTRLNTGAAREHEGIDVCDVLQDENNNNNNNNTNGVCEIGKKNNNEDDNDDDHHQTSEVGQWQIREDVGLLVRMLHSLYTELPKQGHLTEDKADSNNNNNTDNDTSANVKYEWRVTISAVELYNEKLRDLLPLEQTAAAAGQQQQQEPITGGATMSSFASYSAFSAKTATMAAREARQSIVTNTTDSTSLPPSMLGRGNRQQQQQQQQQRQTQSGTTGAAGQTRNERLDTASPDPPSPRVQSPHGHHPHHHSDRAHCVHGGNGTRSQTHTVTKKKTNTTTSSSINKCDKLCSEVQLRARSQGSAWLRRSSSRAAIGSSGGGGGGENLSFAAGPRTSCLGLSTANGAAGVAQGAMSLARNEDVAVVGLQKHAAPSFAAALQLIRKMLYYRTVHATLLNQNSNRAHTLFFVEVEQRYTTQAKEREGDVEEREAAVSASNTNDEGAGRAASQQQEQQQQRVLRGSVAAAGPTVRVRKAVLTLVDLAGSERVSQTGVEGVRLQEARKINLSLLCLGNVIRRITARHTTSTAASTADHTPFASSLQGPGVDHTASLARSLNEAQSHVRGKNAGPVHIPYRDSKLTQLLQNSFGGNTITFVLCTISAAHRNAQETLSTLQFATMVKQVKNTATINSVMAASLTPAMASQLLHELRATQHELARLRRALREKDAALATMALQLQQQQVQQHLTQNAKASTHKPVRDANPTAATHAVNRHAEKRQEDTKPTNTNTNSNTRRKEVMVVRQAGSSQAAERPGRHAAVKELSVEALALRRAETKQNNNNCCKGKSAEEGPVPPFCTTEQQQRQYESIHMSPTTHGVRPLRHKQQQQQQPPPQPTNAEAEANTVKGEGVQGSLARRQGGPGAKTQPTASQARPRVAPMQRRQHSNNNNTNKRSPPHGSNSRNIVKSLREQEKESKAKASKWNQLMSHIKTVLNKHGRTTA